MNFADAYALGDGIDLLAQIQSATSKAQPTISVGVQSLFGDTGSLLEDTTVSATYTAAQNDQPATYNWTSSIKLDFTPEDKEHKDEITVDLSNLSFGTFGGNKTFLKSATLSLNPGDGNAISLGGVSITPTTLTISYTDNRDTALSTTTTFKKDFALTLSGKATWGAKTTSEDDDFTLDLSGTGTYSQIYTTAPVENNSATDKASVNNPIKIDGGLTAFEATVTGDGMDLEIFDPATDKWLPFTSVNVSLDSSGTLPLLVRTSPDTAHPTLVSSTPANEANNVGIDANIVLTFSEDVRHGTGEILIKELNTGTVIHTIPVTDDTQISFDGSQVTLNPKTDLNYATNYTVVLPEGAILDTSNNPFHSINKDGTLIFKTIPTVEEDTTEPTTDPVPNEPGPVVDDTPADPAPAGTNIQPTDDDGDGLKEVVTASDGTTVDGNRDGIPDAEQTEVAGLRLINDGAVGSDYGAISIGNGLQLAAVTLTSVRSDNTLAVTTRGGGTLAVTTPTGISNAFAGVVSFDVSGVEPGGSTTATIAFPTGLAANGDLAYLRFNYDTNRFEEYVDAEGNPLYSFQDSNGDGTPDGVVLQLVDGDPQWDGDGIANGNVVDPGFLGTGKRSFSGTKRGDSLIGNVLANEMRGKAGKDSIYGGLGADFIHGGKGADRIIYYTADESTAGQADTVKFGKKDRFQFRSFDGDNLTEGQQSLRYIGKKAFTGAAGELRLTGSGLQADTTGDAQADFVVNFAKAAPWFSEQNILL